MLYKTNIFLALVFNKSLDKLYIQVEGKSHIWSRLASFGLGAGSRTKQVLNSLNDGYDNYSFCVQVNKAMKLKVGTCLLLTLLVAGPLPATSYSAEPPFWDRKGQAGTIEQYTGKGKWLVVMIWASDCHVCDQEAQSYLEFHKRHRNSDASVLGISMDGKEKQKAALAFMDRHQLTFPNLIGEPETVAQMYMERTGMRWIGTPTFLVYAPDGKLLAQQAGAAPASLIEDFIKSNQAAYSAKQDPS